MKPPDVCPWMICVMFGWSFTKFASAQVSGSDRGKL
jgi:hypothetical protein